MENPRLMRRCFSQRKARIEVEAERKKRAEARGETYEPKEEKDEDSDQEKEAEKEPLVPLPNSDVIMKIDGRAVLIRLEDSQTYILSEPDLVNTMAFNTQGGAQLANVILNEIIREGDLDTVSVDFDVSLHGVEDSRNIIKLTNSRGVHGHREPRTPHRRGVCGFNPAASGRPFRLSR